MRAWEDKERIAQLRLRCWKDFDSTLERIRLMLLAPDSMTRAERNDYEWIRDAPDLVVGVFVRNAIYHGTTYTRVHSLGTTSNPDVPSVANPAAKFIQWEKFGAKPERVGAHGLEMPPRRERDDRSKFPRDNDDWRGRGGDRGQGDKFNDHGRGGGGWDRGHRDSCQPGTSVHTVHCELHLT